MRHLKWMMIVIVIMTFTVNPAWACYRCAYTEQTVQNGTPCPEACVWSLKGFGECENLKRRTRVRRSTVGYAQRLNRTRRSAVQHVLTITLTSDGRLQVTGPIEQPVLAYGMLEAAKDAVRTYKEQQQRLVQPVSLETPGALRNLG